MFLISKNNAVIENSKVIKEIVKRLEENKDYIFLCDRYDGSEIKISDGLMKIINRYYNDRLCLKKMLKTNDIISSTDS
ncbi:hypothetical protein [Clostridium magnum]|uniref:hypothetical protein n=1 Tax=Clostridium magnum TaxID=33954 RepID=UPI00093276F8|nr:hypothetical protein [Clostridium magnum]